jgi:filamentous hemagglutinin family protein
MFFNHHRKLLLATTAIIAIIPAFSNALPTGGSVSSGTASISTSGSTTTVNQSSSKAVINWTGFNTTNGQTVNFSDQQGSASITLNRVSGGATTFDGSLTSNGSVWVINPNGVLIGSTGKVSTAGFLATTSNITDSNFMNGTYNFTPGGGSVGATVSNAGNITVAGAGLAALVAPNVANSGTISAKAGTITLASGDIFTVDLADDGLINLAASPAMKQQGLANTGTLNATGGSVVFTAAQASNVLDNLINLDGEVRGFHGWQPHPFRLPQYHCRCGRAYSVCVGKTQCDARLQRHRRKRRRGYLSGGWRLQLYKRYRQHRRHQFQRRKYHPRRRHQSAHRLCRRGCCTANER